jgi:hypothetical protein
MIICMASGHHHSEPEKRAGMESGKKSRKGVGRHK